jgi:hypothetical protein
MPDGSEEALKFFLRHFVGLNLTVKLPDGSQKADAYSCFVIEMEGKWFLATAGHILNRIYKEILPRCEVLACSLYDAWHKDMEQAPIPFNLYDNDHFEAHEEEEGIDVGFLPLSDMHQRLLVANGIRAFDAVGWRGDLNAMTRFAVLGMPTQFIAPLERVATGVAVLRFAPIMLSLTRVAEPAEMKKPFPRFYGQHAPVMRNELGGTLYDLDGLSGGPILGFRPTDQGDKYHLVAIQSGWHRRLRIVTGPLFQQIAGALAEYLAEAKPDSSQGGPSSA